MAVREDEQAYRRALAVIPCLNERAHIGSLIDGLLDDPRWEDPLVVVADGGSCDGTVELVEDLASRDRRVRLVRNAKQIQSAGVNLAATLHGADRGWLVRVDAHSEYPRGYVSSLIEEAQRVGTVASVVVAMRSQGGACFQRAVAAAQNSRLGAGGSAHRTRGGAGFVDHGHHALIDLETFFAAGGYNETFTHNEDAEFDVRLRKSGGRIWLTRAIEVSYFPRATARSLFRQYLNYGRGRARTLLRHRIRPRPRQLAPLAVAPALVLLLLAPAWPVAALPAAAWALGSCVYGAGLALAERSLCALMSGPAAMIMHTGWSLGFWARLMGSGWRAPTADPSPEALHER